MMKMLVSLLLGSLAGSTVLTLSTKAAQATWFTIYRCGEHTVTVRAESKNINTRSDISNAATEENETGEGYTYSYLANGPAGELVIEDGDRTRGEGAWFYSFENNNTVYLIEDLWDTDVNQPDSAFLSAIQYTDNYDSGTYILEESCTKLEAG